MHDYSHLEDTKEIPGANLMTVLIELADKQEKAEKEIARLELLLEEAKTNLKNIQEYELPKLMDGLSGEITLPDKRTIKISEKIRANLSKENKPIAFKWMETTGNSSLIKRRFIIEFNKNQAEEAEAFQELLKTSKKPLNIQEENNVHWQTLDAFVRQQLENGSGIPLTTFGVFRQRISKIIRPQL